MAKSLYDAVTQVQSAYSKVAEHTSVDVRPHLKKLYEERSSNPIVNSLLKEETTFVDKLIRYFEGKESNRRDLEECLGLELPILSINLLAAIGLTAAGAEVGLLKAKGLGRRDLLKIGGTAALGALAAGGVQHEINTHDLAGLIDYLKRAQFLDNTYRSVSQINQNL